MLCDLGVVHTISSLDVSAYSVGGNSVKGMKVELYDTPALSGTPVHTQEFTIAKTGKTTLNLTDTNGDPVSVQARYAKFTLTSNYGGDRVGVGDVMFNVENYLKTPTSSSMNSSEVATLSGYSVSNLYVMNANAQWCSNAADTTNGYFNGTNKNPVFTFNYSTPVTLSNVFIQTYSANGNSLKDFQLEFTDTNGNQSTYNFTMTDCNYGVQNVFSFPEIENVTSVKMTVTSNFRGIAPGGGDRIGVGGVYFTNLEIDYPTTPEKLDAPLRADNTMVRPTGAAYVTDGSSRTADKNGPLSALYDGSGTGCGSKAWYTNQVGSENDFLNKGFSPIIDLTLPKGTYDSFSVWGYGSAGNQMTEFILELLNDGEVVYADDYQMGRRTAGQYATFSLDGNYLFDTARITVLDTGFGRFTNSGGDRVGFAEIAFYQEPYYFANSPDASDETWTIDGTTKKGVQLTDNGEQTATFENSIVLNAGGTFDVGEGKTLLLSGVVSGTGKLEKAGAGTLTLSGANTYTGETVISGGTLELTGDALQTNGPITIDSGKLEFNVPDGQTKSISITLDNILSSTSESVIKTGNGTLKIDASEGAIDVSNLVVAC
ncbi:MAG: autotransporter-associated beta strand repeat-containing protein, partial [Thermoguttaceae bacterium]|nr:autotransporter-associated beta strand repeat-containing protein [Thermoguttaceae bacterium]